MLLIGRTTREICFKQSKAHIFQIQSLNVIKSVELHKNYTDHNPRNITAMYVKLTEKAYITLQTSLNVSCCNCFNFLRLYKQNQGCPSACHHSHIKESFLCWLFPIVYLFRVPSSFPGRLQGDRLEYWNKEDHLQKRNQSMNRKWHDWC